MHLSASSLLLRNHPGRHLGQLVIPAIHGYPTVMRISRPGPGDVIHIEKIAPDGRFVIGYDGWLLADDDPILLLARWDRPDLPLSYVTFACGDLLLEAYYRQRPYNIFALFDGRSVPADAAWGQIIAGAAHNRRAELSLRSLCRTVSAECPLKGYYVNFARLVDYDDGNRRLIWRDLALDIWVPAAGEPLVLDEEEYQQLRLTESDPELARDIEKARRSLLHQAQTHAGVFAVNPGRQE